MISYSRNIYLDESYAVGHTTITDSIIDKKIYVVMLHLNKKVGFKKTTMCYRKNSIVCGALHSGITKWTSSMGWNFGPLEVTRGMGKQLAHYGYFQI